MALFSFSVKLWIILDCNFVEKWSELHIFSLSFHILYHVDYTNYHLQWFVQKQKAINTDKLQDVLK